MAPALCVCRRMNYFAIVGGLQRQYCDCGRLVTIIIDGSDCGNGAQFNVSVTGPSRWQLLEVD